MKEALSRALAGDSDASVDRILASTFWQPRPRRDALAEVIRLSDRKAEGPLSI
ncbi:MAG: hypothetical protein FWD69_07205 [Polyangiaceae bacterium]|nr:hypothetical protein [Polyangiaceae bacterium]